jgi:hypothetical protein
MATPTGSMSKTLSVLLRAQYLSSELAVACRALLSANATGLSRHLSRRNPLQGKKSESRSPQSDLSHTTCDSTNKIASAHSIFNIKAS